MYGVTALSQKYSYRQKQSCESFLVMFWGESQPYPHVIKMPFKFGSLEYRLRKKMGHLKKEVSVKTQQEFESELIIPVLP